MHVTHTLRPLPQFPQTQDNFGSRGKTRPRHITSCGQKLFLDLMRDISMNCNDP